MAIKAKPKSFELDILTEAEVAVERGKGVELRPDTDRPPPASPMSRFHAGVDMDKLPAMNDKEAELFDLLRRRGTYVVVIKKGKKYYLEDDNGGVAPNDWPIKTKLVDELIKKGWLAKSVRGDYEAYFVTSHMVFGWRKRVGI